MPEFQDWQPGDAEDSYKRIGTTIYGGVVIFTVTQEDQDGKPTRDVFKLHIEDAYLLAQRLIAYHEDYHKERNKE